MTGDASMFMHASRFGTYATFASGKIAGMSTNSEVNHEAHAKLIHNPHHPREIKAPAQRSTRSSPKMIAACSWPAWVGDTTHMSHVQNGL